MPFSTDTNWPLGLINIFDVCRKSRNQLPLEIRYYGPYDRLFNYVMIQDSFNFTLTLQIIHDETSMREHVESDTFMVVSDLEQNPVLIVGIKDDRWAKSADTRRRADTKMRQLYDQTLYKSAIPQLYGLSLCGTSFRVYCGEKATGKVTPAFIGRPDVNQVYPFDFLEGRWNLDILSQDGFLKVKEIVTYITTNAVGKYHRWRICKWFLQPLSPPGPMESRGKVLEKFETSKH